MENSENMLVTISEDMLVTLQYQLYVKGDDGGALELMEETTKEQPLKYLHGAGMMLPKFEENLSGLSVGDEFDFMIPSADAYGEYEDENVVDLPKNIFFIDGKFDEEKVFEGAIVPLMDTEGNRINAEIVEIKEDVVKVDFNHPLAGDDLYFKGVVEDIHIPTEEECFAMKHHGCGGGCSSSCGGGDCGGGGCSCGGCC